MPGPEPTQRNPTAEGLSTSERARGRKLTIASHPAGNAFGMALTDHLPTLTLMALGAGEAMIGAQSAIKTGATLLQLPTLRRVAHTPKKTLLVAGHTLAVVGMLPLLGFARLAEYKDAGAEWPSWVALASFSIVAAGISIANTVWFPMLRAYVEPARIGQFFGLLRSGWHLSLIFFYFGASWWLEAEPGRYAPLFWVLLGLGAARFLLIVRMPERSEMTESGIRVREAFAAIRNNSDLQRYLIGVTTGQALRASVLPFALVMLRREIGLADSQLLSTTVAGFAGGLVSLYLWGRLIDRKGPAIVFQATSIGMAILTLALLGITDGSSTTFHAVIAFFFLYSILSVGFGLADTHVLFHLAPVDSPARTLVACAVIVGLVASILPLLAGISIEGGLRGSSDRLLVYHGFFVVTAVIQAVNWWPMRAFRSADAIDTRGGIRSE